MDYKREYERWLAQSAANEAAKNRNVAALASYIPDGTSAFRKAVVLEALKYVGVLEYRWGWESLVEGADCSGFLRAIFMQFGIDVPHYSYWIATMGTKVISIDYARPGDIIGYRTWDPAAGRGHVVMYIGRDANGVPMVVESPQTGMKVRVAPMSTSGLHTIQDVIGNR